MNLDLFLSRLEGVRKTTSGHMARCPAHDDQRQSLSIGEGDTGGIIIHCFAGCVTADILAALGMTLKDLMPVTQKGPPPTIVYRYEDERGEPKFEAHRSANKRFWLSEPGGKPGIKGIDTCLYRIPDLLRADPSQPVFICEGEKDTDRLWSVGLVATTNPMGADAWKQEYAEWLKDHLPNREFVILPDNDEAGLKHADEVLHSLQGAGLKARSKLLPHLPAKGDVSDWLSNGGTPAELLKIASEPTKKTKEVSDAEEAFSAFFVGGDTEYSPPARMEPEAFYGLAGDVVRAIDPHTEAAREAVLGSFLVELGCLIGRSPYIYRDGMKHTCNEFLALVGPSGGGRKGSASRRSGAIIHSVDCNWTFKNNVRGLSSGEGLIYAVRDPTAKDDGVVDKRLMVIEEELAQILHVMGRDGNTLSVVIRSAWDNAPLAVTTKNSPLKATGTHISILGHITDTELRRLLTQTEKANGFANRFLWIYSKRSKFLPHGGGQVPSAPLVQRLKEAVDEARKTGEVDFTDEARAVWEAVYNSLAERPPGLLGAVTSRAEAHVIRLALLYTLLDCKNRIEVPHLLAALAVWDYSERTCLYVFGDATGDDVADVIEEALQDVYPGYLTRTEISEKFSRNVPAGSIKKALRLLFQLKRAVGSMVPTGGRPSEKWVANKCDPYEKSRKSTLSIARRAVAQFGSKPSWLQDEESYRDEQ